VKELKSVGAFTKNGVPSTQLLNSQSVAQHVQSEVRNEAVNVENLRRVAYGKAKCGKLCYMAWWIVSVLYLLAIIFVGVSVNSTLKLPTQAA
jgi:hypothetical protein